MERNSGAMTFFGVLYLVGIALLCVQLARLAGNVWVGVLVFGGFMAIHIAFNLALVDEFSWVFWLAWGGAWAIAYAGMIAEYAGRWIWAIPWALAGVLFLSIGGAAIGKVKWVANATVMLGIWALTWAVVGPLWLYGKNQEETQEWTLDLLKSWWWVPVAFIGGLLAIGLLAVAGAALLDRRKTAKRARQRKARSQRRPAPQPFPATPPVAGPVPEPKPKLRPVELQKLKPAPGPVVIGTAAAAKQKPVLGATQPRKKPLATSYVPPGGGSGASAFAGEALYTTSVPAVDLLARARDHFVLTEDGRLSRWHQGSLDDVPGVSLARPKGVGAGGDVVVAADRDKRLVSVAFGNGGPPQVTSHRVDYAIGAFAVNPFGTIVAYAPAQKPAVFAVLLGSGETQVLSEDVGSTSAMAYSGDGRVLALGGKDGRIRMFDMSTRRIVRVLDPPTSERDNVVSVAECPERGWVGGYESGRVVHWGASGETEGVVQERHHVSALAVGSRSGAVAVGCDDGHIVVHPISLDSAVVDAAVAADTVVGIAFEEDEEAVVVAARDGSVRRAGV